jgi:hypothetical protein
MGEGGNTVLFFSEMTSRCFAETHLFQNSPIKHNFLYYKTNSVVTKNSLLYRPIRPPLDEAVTKYTEEGRINIGSSFSIISAFVCEVRTRKKT